MINLHKSTEPFEFDDSNWFGYEKPSVLEAFRVLSKEGYYITISGHDYDMRKKRLEKEYEKNTKAPGSAENSIKGDLSGNKSIEHCSEPIPGSPLSAVEGIKLKRKDNQNTSENPALKESATQFNDALLDEQAKKIAELTKENERLERVSKTTTDEFNKLYYRMITKSDKIEALGKEIAQLDKIINDKNLKIEELTKEKLNLEDQITVLNACKKHNDKIDRKQIKCLGKEIARLNGIIHDKNEEIKRKTKGCCKLITEDVDLKKKLSDKDAVLADVTEELRLSKIREKNLTEVCQKYVKEVETQKDLVDDISLKYDGAKYNLKLRIEECEKLKEELANKVVDKIDAQALKSAESALAYKEKVIADLTHKLKAKHKKYVWYKGAYDAAQQILNTIADYAAKHPDKKFSDPMVEENHPTIDNPEEIEIEKAVKLVRKAMKEGHTVTIDYKD